MCKRQELPHCLGGSLDHDTPLPTTSMALQLVPERSSLFFDPHYYFSGRGLAADTDEECLVFNRALGGLPKTGSLLFLDLPPIGDGQEPEFFEDCLGSELAADRRLFSEARVGSVSSVGSVLPGASVDSVVAGTGRSGVVPASEIEETDSRDFRGISGFWMPPA